MRVEGDQLSNIQVCTVEKLSGLLKILSCEFDEAHLELNTLECGRGQGACLEGTAGKVKSLVHTLQAQQILELLSGKL